MLANFMHYVVSFDKAPSRQTVLSGNAFKLTWKLLITAINPHQAGGAYMSELSP